MLLTSSKANKLLSKLTLELNTILRQEDNARYFTAAIEEDIESIRPEYDYAETRKKQAEIEQKIRALKHAINVFNSTQVIPEFDMTIDEMLVYLPQLNRRLSRLSGMSDVLPKERLNTSKNFIEYRYANYDVKLAEKDYNEIYSEIQKAQLALDKVNTTVEFEVDCL